MIKEIFIWIIFAPILLIGLAQLGIIWVFEKTLLIFQPKKRAALRMDKAIKQHLAEGKPMTGKFK